MKKRQTSKVRRRSRTSVLEVRVMSPRIAWLGALKFLGGVAKIACLLAVLTAIGWGIWQGIQRAFYENPDFRLQAIDLNENPVFDEAGLVDLTGIDLTSSLFELNIDAIATQLESLPAVASARAERHLPGTLVVRVTTREPRAWIACPAENLPATRGTGGLLVDAEGFVFPCSELHFQTAERLPVIHLPSDPENPILPGKKARHSQLQWCFNLLDAACANDPEAIHWIESITQTKEWALTLVTRNGTAATFGLGDHARQIADLRAALEHANRQNYTIATINLIPKENIPITVADETAPPRAVPVAEPTPGELREERRSRDLNSLLNRG